MGETISDAYKPKRPLLAAVFSALLPGAGQLYLGEPLKAAFFWLAFCAALGLYWPLRAPRDFFLFLGASMAMTVVCVAAVCEVFLPRRNARRASWGVVLFLPLAVLVSIVHRSWIVRASGFLATKMPSASMEQTISTGDSYLVDLWFYRRAAPIRQDVVLFRREDYLLAKRVIAVPGDVIEGKKCVIFLNAKGVDEPYVRHVNCDVDEPLNNFGPVLIPPGKLFVMGDNRDTSLDSRTPEFGFLDSSAVVGKALYIYLPKDAFIPGSAHPFGRRL